MRTGRAAATEYYGMPFFAWLATDHERVEQFSGAMANLTDGIKSGAIAGYDFGDARRIVDLGGSDGTLLAHVLRRVPEASGVVHDLPHVVGASATRLLANIAASAPSGARVRAFELVVPPGSAPHMSTMIDLTMLGMLTGRERDEQEMRALVEGAGLTFDGVAGTPTPISVVEAHVP